MQVIYRNNATLLGCLFVLFFDVIMLRSSMFLCYCTVCVVPMLSHVPSSLKSFLSTLLYCADSIEVEREFSQSKIKEYLREMISILRADTDTLSDGTVRNDQFDEDSGSCFDYFIQYHIVREFCIRAIKDTPRGFLPLILNFIASILQNVTYPLLPHVSIHKAIANLLFFSLHYESLQLRDSRTLHGVQGVDGSVGLGDRDRDRASVAQYQERIGDLRIRYCFLNTFLKKILSFCDEFQRLIFMFCSPCTSYHEFFLVNFIFSAGKM